jgi:Leucine-rich repeat (LRR) protein
LGVDVDGEKKLVGPPLPSLSSSLKMIKLDHNHLPSIPKSIYAPELTKLEKIDLSNNQINEIPKEFCENLSSSLTELNLDHNLIASLPRAIGLLVKLKSLSLESNKIVVLSTSFDQRNPQPLPEELFVSTPLIDLNLKGNRMTNGQLNEFEGFDAFLERRQKLKSKNIHGGALTDLGMCGLE